MKLNIKPFREFWIDCFSTSIFSILISKTSIDKVFVYNNNYTYTESRIDFLDGSKAWSIMPQINMSEVTEKVLTDITYLDFKEKRDPISLLKMLLLKEKIVFLGVDVYYWIPDNFHWHRNHFNHYSVLNGFDEEKKIFYVLETGAMGYKEYEIKEEELLLAIRGYTGNGSIIAKINSNMESAPYSYKEFLNNARSIINSIEEIVEKKDIFLSESDMLEEKYWIVLDHIQTHLYGMESRQKANRLLVDICCMKNEMKMYIKEFEKLEKKYDNLKKLVLKSNVSHKYISPTSLRDDIFVLLIKEKEIWNSIIETC